MSEIRATSFIPTGLRTLPDACCEVRHGGTPPLELEGDLTPDGEISYSPSGTLTGTTARPAPVIVSSDSNKKDDDNGITLTVTDRNIRLSQVVSAEISPLHSVDGDDDGHPDDIYEDMVFAGNRQAASLAWNRFVEAGVGLRKKVEVENFIKYGEPEEKMGLKWWRWKVTCIVDGWMARIFLTVLVCVNAILIGVEAENTTPESAPYFDVCEVTFLVVFVVELMLKFFGIGWLFFRDSWNVIDLVVVGASVVDMLMSLAAGVSSNGLSTLRLIRIFRIVRVFGMFDKLAALLLAFTKSLQQVVWVAILAFIFLYMFAVLGHGFFSDDALLAANPEYKPEWFNTIGHSLITLFQLMTLDDWANIMRPVGNTRPWSWVYTMIFVLLGIGIMNLAIAIFIDELLQRSEELNKQKAVRKKAKVDRNIAVATAALKDFDVDDDGYIDHDELTEALTMLDATPDLKSGFDRLGVPVPLLKQNLELCDEGVDGHVDVDMLVDMVKTGESPPTRNDIFLLRHTINSAERRNQEAIGNLRTELTGRLDTLQMELTAMTNHLSNLIIRGF